LYKKVFFAIILFVGCVSPNLSWENDPDQGDSIWICHNPESFFHDKECTEKTSEQCLSEGDQSKFCWVLSKEDCSSENMRLRFDFCK